MTDDPTGQEKIDRPHAFFRHPQEVVIEPTLTKDQKTEALDAMEQDSRQLAAASDEGMAGGERNKLQDVLEAKDLLALPPVELAYETVLKDLRSRTKTDVAGDARALLEQALAALSAVVKSPSLNDPANAGPANAGPGTYDGPSPGSPADINDEMAREKLDP